jgi:fatty-acyl-CoA synthase
VGATAALINSNLEGHPLSHAVIASTARIAVVEARSAEALRSRVDLRSQLDRVFVFNPGDFEDRLAEAPARSFPRVVLGAMDDYVYIYTSGTTGLPKPCRISHARAFAAASAFGPLFFGFEPGDKLYCVLPLYHSSALLLGAGAAIKTRTPMALRATFSAKAFWEDVQRYNATAMIYIGELCRYLVNTPRSDAELNNPIRVALGNGLRPDVWESFQKRFDIPHIREFYAATEAPGILINMSGRVGAVGRMPLRMLYRLDAAPRSAASEFRGYTDAAATEKKVVTNVFKHGDRYYRTGDLMRFDEDDYFYFVDRIGDTYRWKGENVSTAEVADVISQVPGVLETTVCGIHVPGMEGQAGLAAVVCENGFDPRSFWKVAQELPQYAQPRFVRVIDAMNKTATFKIQKTNLRKDGIDPASQDGRVYVRQDDGYVPLTPDLWHAVQEGTARL